VLASLAAAVVLGGGGELAWAGDVRGEVKFSPKKMGAPPVRNRGFVERIENPTRPIQSFDPTPSMVVVLDGGPVDDGAKKPLAGAVHYDLLGESFAAPVLPVVAKTRVQINNRGPREAVLVTPDDPELLDSVAIKPKSFHEITVTEPGKAVVIRAQDSIHLVGRIAVFPHRYFATVDGRGRFEIKDVPDGTWQARVWYRDGWVDGAGATVEVSGRRAAAAVVTVSSQKLRDGSEQ
jgi:hypothetical protein